MADRFIEVRCDGEDCRGRLLADRPPGVAAQIWPRLVKRGATVVSSSSPDVLPTYSLGLANSSFPSA